jgi:arylsulfatase A-like enzyme
MKFKNKILNVLLLLSICSSIYAQQPKRKPNIIFILTDDLGYGDVGVFFQNYRAKLSKPFQLTPNLNQMAANGAMLLNSYAAAPVCAPSRASLLLGQSQGHANIRDNQFDKALADNYTLGNVLQKAGYKTAVIGKWGLQGEGKPENWIAHPLNRGFDYFYGYMRHEDGHEHYPKEGIYRGKKEVYENRTELAGHLDKCYTGDLWTAVAKRWIVEHRQKNNDQPFFIYLSYDTPHAVLELPTQAYPDGGGLNGGIQWLGKSGQMINTAKGLPDSWMDPDYASATYDHDQNPLTPQIPWPDTYKRYATSTKRIDAQVGDLLKLLSDLKIDEQTIVVFTSDNGPSNEAYLPKPHVPFAANFFESFGPFNGIKRDVLEGGLRTPTIVQWAKHIAPNSIVGHPNISYDWMPTFTHAAGLSAPSVADGVSLLPSLLKKNKQRESLIYVEYEQNGKTPNYPEFALNNRNRIRNQMQMLRVGNTVGIRYDIKSGQEDFELYDIVNDQGQAKKMASSKKNIALQEQLKEKAMQVRMVNKSAPRPYDEDFVPGNKVAKLKSGLELKTYRDLASWVPNTTDLKELASQKVENMNLVANQMNANVYEFKGYLKIDQAASYTFFLKTSGKAFFRIHEAAVIDADYNYVKNTELYHSIKLKKGYHQVKLTIKLDHPSDQFELMWSAADLKKQVIDPRLWYY